MNRRGMTLIELMIVVVILAILANLAVPALNVLRVRADAAHIVGDFEAVRVAAFDRFAAAGSYPATGAWGQIPPELVGSLPSNFQFTYKDATYRWHSWLLPSGLPSNPTQSVLLGLDVQSADPDLMAALAGAFRSGVAFGTPTEITLVIE